MTDVSRLLRGTLPILVATAVATAFALPASARQQARAAGSGGVAAPARAAQWWLTELHVARAWQAASGRGKGVTVAVLSTGVDAAHRDLSGSVTTGPDYSASGRAAGQPFWGAEGTAVAGLIAGHGHGAGGGTGITGVAPAARILSVRVTLEYNDPLNSDAAITGRLPGAIAAGIRYAVGHGAKVIALPLDPGTLGAAAMGDPAAAGGSAAERAAVSYAIGHDVVLIAPAGDNGASTGAVNYPAAYPGVVAVGATTRNGQPAPFTITRSYVALTAPGAALTVASPDGGYGSLASTDMSAALTAGVAALVRARYPRLTAAEVTQALERGAVRPAGRAAPGTGHGALDAAGALAAATAIAPAHPAPASAARPSAPATATSPARAPASAHRATARPSPGTLAGSLLRDGVIGAGVLIVALLAALALTGARRRRAQAARMPQPPRAGQGGGSHARRPRAALPAAEPRAGTRNAARARAAITVGPSSTIGSSITTGSAVIISPVNGGAAALRTGPGSGAPRIVPATASTALGGSSRARSRRRTADEPPWEPATQPTAPPPAAPAARPIPRAALPAAGSQPRTGPDAPLPPWEQAPGELAAAPVPADLPDWTVTSTGPMYIWNPAATTAPMPAVEADKAEELSGTGGGGSPRVTPRRHPWRAWI